MFRIAIIRTLIFSLILMFSFKMVDLVRYVSDFANKAYPKNNEAFAQEPSAKEALEEAAPVQAEIEAPVSVEQIKTMSNEEIEVLQRLSSRKNKLIRWQDDLELKESMMKITEDRIDRKLDELRKLKYSVEAALVEYRKIEEDKASSLVKIYEGMKPKNAADIMAKMKIPDILPIMIRMKTKNAALILAKMDPMIAKEVTSRLTEIGRLENPE